MPTRSDAFLCSSLLLLSTADSALTHLWLASGLATEANPLLAAAWEVHPATFHGVKAALVCGSAAILHSLHGKTPGARIVMGGAAAVYAAVVAFHLAHF